MSKLFSDETLVHYGIPGQKWGTRRWQYIDGRFNEEGKLRYFGSSKKINQILYESSKVNPNYNKNIKGYTNNCAYCAATYIFRRAGFDKTAKSNKIGIKEGDTLKFAQKIFDKKSIKDSYYNKDFYKLSSLDKSYENFNKVINKLKDGESSIISIYNAKKRTGGHYLNAEKIDNNIYIIDSQSNKIYSLNKFKKEFPGWTIAGITNIDYKQINDTINNKNINEIMHFDIMKGGENMFNDTLSHYGILGQKWGQRNWQYYDGRFNEEGKLRYFGDNPTKNFSDVPDMINNVTSKGHYFINTFFRSDRSINKEIGRDIDKEIQKVFLNKNNFSSPKEFNERLYELNMQKNIYNANLKPKTTWRENFSNQFSSTTAQKMGEKIGKDFIDFLLG